MLVLVWNALVTNLRELYAGRLPMADHARDAIVMQHDGYVCHKGQMILRDLVSLGHGAALLIGGGSALHAHVCDVCLHAMLSRIYKAGELEGSLELRVAHPEKRSPPPISRPSSTAESGPTGRAITAAAWTRSRRSAPRAR